MGLRVFFLILLSLVYVPMVFAMEILFILQQHGLQDGDAIFLAWKNRSIPMPTNDKVLSCGLCGHRNAFKPCDQCNMLFFGIVADTFNARGEPYSHPFSNFYSQAEDLCLKALRIDGLDYITAENYFQAARAEASNEYRKTAGRSMVSIDQLNDIAVAPSPGKAWYRGKSSAGMIPIEDEVLIMKRALSAKFGQHPDLLQQLLDTGDAILLYVATTPSVWSYPGHNGLGLLLMDLRALLQEKIQAYRDRMNRLLCGAKKVGR